MRSALAMVHPSAPRETVACALPTGEGLLSFSTLDQALAAFEEVTANYQKHSAAARTIAETYFAAERVLGGLLDAL